VLPSSDELVALYTSTLRSDIVFGWYTEDLTLYSVSTLLQRQEGYRWAVGKHDKLLPGWNEDWVVIGHVMGADPIIAAPKEPGTCYYDSECARYISRDPIGLIGSVNAFAFVPNPFGFSDFFGLMPWAWDPDDGMGHHLVPARRASPIPV
jgi:hypothetical protein